MYVRWTFTERLSGNPVYILSKNKLYVSYYQTAMTAHTPISWEYCWREKVCVWNGRIRSAWKWADNNESRASREPLKSRGGAERALPSAAGKVLVGHHKFLVISLISTPRVLRETDEHYFTEVKRSVLISFIAVFSVLRQRNILSTHVRIFGNIRESSILKTNSFFTTPPLITRFFKENFKICM